MKILGIDHVSLNVQDMEASASFYAEVLGFRRLETVAMDDGFSITYFEIPGGGRLELFDYGGLSRPVQRVDTEVGLRHLAFAIDDAATAEETLREKGVPIVLPTTDIQSLGARVVLFLDPSGVTLEFCQTITASGEKRT